MISSVFICDSEKPKCRGTLFEEIYVTQIIPPKEDEESQTGKQRIVLGYAKYIYRCLECGKKYDFSRLDEPVIPKNKSKPKEDLEL